MKSFYGLIRVLPSLFLVFSFAGGCSNTDEGAGSDRNERRQGGISSCLSDPGCSTLLTVGHRGVAFFLPENTWPAYAYALDHGADIVETDVRTSADGIFVVFHDSTVDRTTDGTGEVAGMTVEELKDLLIPADDLTLNSLDPLQLRYRSLREPLPAPQTILTLDELFDLLGDKGILYIDFKAGDLAALAEIIRDRNLQDRVYVAARTLEQAQTLASVPGTAMMADPPRMEELSAFLALDPVLVELTLEEATPDVVGEIHQAGVKIMMNALGEMDLLLRFQVLLDLNLIEPLVFLCTFFSELIPQGVLRVQDGAFDPIGDEILKPVSERIEEVYGRLVEAGADVIQTDFLDLLAPFVQKINQERLPTAEFQKKNAT